MKRERRVKKSSVMAMAMFSSHGLDDPDNVEISTIGVLLALGPQGTCSSGLAQSRGNLRILRSEGAWFTESSRRESLG